MKAYLVLALGIAMLSAHGMTARPDRAPEARVESERSLRYRLDGQSGLYDILASPSFSVRSKMFHIKVALVKRVDSMYESVTEYWHIFVLGIFVIASGVYIHTQDRRERRPALAYRFHI